MYQVEKRFTLPIGHRLSKHLGRCSSIHGHNIVVLVGVESNTLNENYMVIDFSDLKKIVQEILDQWDHCLLLNNKDSEFAQKCEEANMRVIMFGFDPTAEKLSEILYHTIAQRFIQLKLPIHMKYVTIYENENSKCTFYNPRIG